MTNSTKLGGGFVLSQASILAALLMQTGLAMADNAENPLIWKGFTLYGTVDVGASYQSHGRPLNDYYSAGAYYFPSKAATDSSAQLSGNGLSQSTLGVRGMWEFAQGWSGLFKLESAVNPTSFKLSDSQKALTQNNGKPITQQTAAADNSLTGPFSMAAYAGIKSDPFGLVTVGRQNTPLKDNILRYDPLGNAPAFSAFGAYGAPAGGGSTENARLNDSIRYQHAFNNIRVDAIYAIPNSSQGGKAWQLGVGSKFGELSLDAVYAEKKGAMLASSLAVSGAAATSISWLNVAHTAAGYSYATPGTVSIGNALAGTASDNNAWGIFTKYEIGAPTLFAGYERMTYSNPSSPRSAGVDSIGGYTFSVVNNGAYASSKILDVAWFGAKYQVDPRLSLMGAAYHYHQNSYTGNACANPAATSPGTTVNVDQNSPCSSGSQSSYSLAATYRFNSYIDGYAGLMMSKMSGGMASGFAHTSVYNAMTGVKLNF